MPIFRSPSLPLSSFSTTPTSAALADVEKVSRFEKNKTLSA